MEFWIKTASGLGYIWQGEDVESAMKPHKYAYIVAVAGGHHRFKINIDSIEGLYNLIEEVNCSVVVSKDSIMIYDDYIE